VTVPKLLISKGGKEEGSQAVTSTDKSESLDSNKSEAEKATKEASLALGEAKKEHTRDNKPLANCAEFSTPKVSQGNVSERVTRVQARKRWKFSIEQDY